MKVLIKTPLCHCWYLYNQSHRDGAPARVWMNGSHEWFVRGLLHRDNGPALEFAWGFKGWYQHGQRDYAKWCNSKDWMAESESYE